MLGGEDGQTFRKTHSEAQVRYASGIDRARTNRKLVTAADLTREGMKPGPKMGALLEEAEAMAVSEGLTDASSVLERLRSSDSWPKAG